VFSQSEKELKFPWLSLEVYMALDTKTIEELEQLAANLRQQIVLHPEHSAVDKAELKDVEDWIALRRQEKTA
jgi:hypothetical protein